MIFELWFSASEGSHSYFPRGEAYEQHRGLLEPDAVLEWTYDAKSYFDAQRARHEHCGFRPYKPEPGWEDTFYESAEG